MDPTKYHTNCGDALWGFRTLERTQRIGLQTYQRALKNHAVWTKQRKQEPTIYPVYKERGACPICGKSAEPNRELDSAFSDVMKMMCHVSQACQRYYCSTEGEPQTKHDINHCQRYHTANLTKASYKMSSMQEMDSLNKEVYVSESEQLFSSRTSQTGSSKSSHHTVFDISASLPQSRKAKHVRFSPGDTVEVYFCA